MKKFILILIPMVLMIWACPVWADDIDDALPENTSLKIRNHTRQMVLTGISKDDATQFTRSLLQHRFQEKYTLQAQNILMQTMQSGLPVDPVMNKAFEGLAKNKPDETIVQAMKKTRSRYAYAYRKAQEVTPDQESQNTLGQSIAQGMRAGLRDKDIERVMAQLQTRTRQMSQNKAEELSLQTFLTASVMARLGVDPDNVSNVVSQALQNQFSAKEMQQLGATFNNQSHQTSPNQLANQFAQQISQGGNPADSGSSNENNAGQSGSDQDSGSSGNDGEGSGSGNTPEETGGSESGSDNTGSGDSDSTEGSEGSGGAGSDSGSSDSGATSGGSSGNNDGGDSGSSDGAGG